MRKIANFLYAKYSPNMYMGKDNDRNNTNIDKTFYYA